MYTTIQMPPNSDLNKMFMNARTMIIIVIYLLEYAHIVRFYVPC